jgi:kynurenine formamidase
VSDLVRIAERYRTWGRWGPNDERGSANFVTASTVAAAARLVRKGAVFSLAIPMDRDGPQSGRTARVNPQHMMIKHGGDMLANWSQAQHGMQFTDDSVYMALQCATQWDALSHVFYDGTTYNGRGPESVTSAGAQHNSITAVRDRAVGRGVLLDVARHYGVPWLEPGDAIQDTDLQQCARSQKVEVGEGDFVLVRTGHLKRRRQEPGWADYVAGPAPGLGLGACDYLCPRRITAAATDTWGAEVIPHETAGAKFPVHVVLLVNAGILIGEIWDLEDLAEDCAADGVYEFMLTAAPLTITGAVGSPINPIAIK